MPLVIVQLQDPAPVDDNVAIPANTRGLLLLGRADDGKAQIVRVDALGNIIAQTAGAISPSNAINGFTHGRVATSATTTVPIRATTYTEPASAAQRSVASASANDTSAGTGARTVRITYFDGSMNGPYTETVTLNGTTPVNTTATDIRYVEKIEVLTVGSGGVNAGIITLYGSTAGGGGTVGTIAASDNQTFWAHHYVRNGKTANITSITGGVLGAQTAGMFLQAKNPANANDAEMRLTDQLRLMSSGNTISRLFGVPIR